jgi:hypothetical protein
MAPAAGFNVQVTPLRALPVTAVVNCWVCEAFSEVVEGVSETVAGLRLMGGLPNLVGLPKPPCFTSSAKCASPSPWSTAVVTANSGGSPNAAEGDPKRMKPQNTEARSV